MASFREKYHLWRKRALPASKADIARLRETIINNISVLNRTLHAETETVSAKLSAISGFIDSLAVGESAA
jgi:hypothetical protein